jgi:Fe2+ or Zn2+ uptake regulation protein
VVETIASSQQALSPLSIFEKARQQHPKLGLVTVYRTLEKLEELGLIQRVHQPAGCHAYISASPGHQHLLLCQTCGKVEFFSEDNEKINFMIGEVGEKSGYRIEEHWLQLFGICISCQQYPRERIFLSAGN